MSEQSNLFVQTMNARTGVATEHPARWGDPQSSQVAATRLRNSGALNAQRRRVLAYLARVPRAMSAKELAAGDTELYYMLARRLPELKVPGYVEAIDALPAQLWRITDAGREALR